LNEEVKTKVGYSIVFMPDSNPQLAIFLRSLANGGAERLMVNLANYFVQDGLLVDLVLTRSDGVYTQEVSPQVRLIDLKAAKLPASLPKLTQYLRENRPKALLTALHYPCEIALWAKKLARVSTRVVVSEHNTLSVEAKRLPQRTARLTPVAARLFYPWADGIVAVSEGVAQDLAQVMKLPRDRAATRIHTIYNPAISTDLIQKVQEPLEFPWFAPGQPPVILGVGRFVAQKDFTTLIKAFARVRQQMDARLVLLGSGQQKQQLEALIEELGLTESVAFPGFVRNPYAYMARSSVFVLSSAWEGFGNVLVEAMAAGTPVISTDCPSGPAEILAQGKYGELVPVGDATAMAEAILRVLKGIIKPVDPDWLAQFKIEAIARQYRTVLGI
jgi:glycosyltransferase involved in cell wall biosynthesis